MAKFESYNDNPQYREQLSLYEVYQKRQATIVMAGDSLIARADWRELLGRDDIANRGIGSDTTAGLCARLDSIVSLKPKIVFIMTGRNDFGAGPSREQIIADLEAVAQGVHKSGAVPVLHHIPCITIKPHASTRNIEIIAVNSDVDKLAARMKCPVIDLNVHLSRDGELLKEYTSDGGHLLGNAYAHWRDEILRVLNEREI